jgi:hypothetical protein
MVSWCGHCFNATCDPVAIEEQYDQRFRLLQESLAAVNADRVPPPPWCAVRPALDDLRKRGLL